MTRFSKYPSTPSLVVDHACFCVTKVLAMGVYSTSSMHGCPSDDGSTLAWWVCALLREINERNKLNILKLNVNWWSCWCFGNQIKMALYSTYVDYFLDQKHWAMAFKQAPINKNKKYEPLVVLSSNLPSQLVVLFSQMGSHHPQILSPIQPILVVGASLFIKNKFGG